MIHALIPPCPFFSSVRRLGVTLATSASNLKQRVLTFSPRLPVGGAPTVRSYNFGARCARSAR